MCSSYRSWQDIKEEMRTDSCTRPPNDLNMQPASTLCRPIPEVACVHRPPLQPRCVDVLRITGDEVERLVAPLHVVFRINIMRHCRIIVNVEHDALHWFRTFQFQLCYLRSRLGLRFGDRGDGQSNRRDRGEMYVFVRFRPFEQSGPVSAEMIDKNGNEKNGMLAPIYH